MLRISILTDNKAGSVFEAEHGLSYLLEIDNETLLFDAGHSDLFLRNACKLGLDIRQAVQRIILSHGHWDHGDGLVNISHKQLFAHPDVFCKRYRKKDHSPIGLSLPHSHYRANFRLQLHTHPVQLTEHLWFLGQIPRENNFEALNTPFEFDDGSDDYVFDDSALAAVVNNQLIVITGCSHSGICNITEHAIKVTGVSSVRAIIGGFHLKYNDKQAQKTIEYFTKREIKELLPSHCTELPALSMFYQAFNIKEVKTGQQYIFQ